MRERSHQPDPPRRLAAALGWEQVPELSDDELRELDEEFEAAQAEARRLADQQQVAQIRSADGLTQPRMFDSDQELNEFLADLRAQRREGAADA